MPLTIELDVDHTRFYVELPSGHHITIPASAEGAATLHRLLLAQKRAATASASATAIGAIGPEQAKLIHAAWYGVGTEASPTQQELDHITKHEGFAEGCPFCRDEARRGVRVQATVSDFDMEPEL